MNLYTSNYSTAELILSYMKDYNARIIDINQIKDINSYLEEIYKPNFYSVIISDKLIIFNTIETLKGFILAVSWIDPDRKLDISYNIYPVNININNAECPYELEFTVDMEAEDLENLLRNQRIKYTFLPLSDDMILELLINEYDIEDLENIIVPEDKIQTIYKQYIKVISETMEPYLVKNLLPIVNEYIK